MTYIDNSAGLNIGMLTFDVEYVFNLASWEKMLIDIEHEGTSSPILKVFQDYFNDSILVTYL